MLLLSLLGHYEVAARRFGSYLVMTAVYLLYKLVS